jgi:hypothetical protein
MSFYDGLITGTSVNRLRSYEVPMDTRERLVARYMWNTALSESLLPALQHLEVALRNSIDLGIKEEYGSEWYDRNPSILGPIEIKKVNEAKDSIVGDGKSVAHDRVVAALGFGFWTSLLDSRYEQSLKNNRNYLWPRLLRGAFPVMPNEYRTRTQLSKRLNSVRTLRNRVFHNEPIWKMPDLQTRYQDILTTLLWLNPQLHTLTEMQDRFIRVYEADVAAFMNNAKSLLATEAKPAITDRK